MGGNACCQRRRWFVTQRLGGRACCVVECEVRMRVRRREPIRFRRWPDPGPETGDDTQVGGTVLSLRPTQQTYQPRQLYASTIRQFCGPAGDFQPRQKPET